MLTHSYLEGLTTGVIFTSVPGAVAYQPGEGLHVFDCVHKDLLYEDYNGICR